VSLSVVEGSPFSSPSLLAVVSCTIFPDGSKIEAQTPDGTRVTTPNPLSSLIGRNALSARTTYAAALKTKPTDWHLGFSMDDHPLPLDLTIYGAIHQHELRKKGGAVSQSVLWQGLYTVTFKKVPGPVPNAESQYSQSWSVGFDTDRPTGRGDGVDGGSRSRPSSPTLSLPEDAPHAKILRLLRVLHRLNALEAEHSAFVREKRALPGSAFVNNKLSAKLTRQLEEPMIVAR
jgi:E3 ubiquitin-protein ligase TRIP12